MVISNTFDRDNIPLMIDKYQYSMIDLLIESGDIEMNVVYELFTRSLSYGYAIFSGLSSLIDIIQNFHFTDSILEYLFLNKIITEKSKKYLRGFKFTLDLYSIQEGEFFFAYQPIVVTVGKLIDSILLETLILSTVNVEISTVTYASQYKLFFNKYKYYDFSLRRTSIMDGLIIARSSYISLFSATSNVLANYLYNIPIIGTVAHSYMQTFSSERDAFINQIINVDSNILLIDTYDINNSLDLIISLSDTLKKKIDGIRIDTKVSIKSIKNIRDKLDKFGLNKVKIIITGDISLESIREYNRFNSDIYAFGIGTSLATCNNESKYNFVYKMVLKNNSIAVTKTGSQSKEYDPYIKSIRRDKNKCIDYIDSYKSYNFDRYNKYPLRDHENILLKQIFNDGKLIYNFTLQDVRCKILDTLHYINSININNYRIKATILS